MYSSRCGVWVFDFVITEPPCPPCSSHVHYIRANSNSHDEMDSKELSEFPTFVKHILKPSGYVVVLLPFYAYQDWNDSFDKTGFQIMLHRYVILYDLRSEDIPPECKHLRADSTYKRIQRILQFQI